MVLLAVFAGVVVVVLVVLVVVVVVVVRRRGRPAVRRTLPYPPPPRGYVPPAHLLVEFPPSGAPPAARLFVSRTTGKSYAAYAWAPPAPRALVFWMHGYGGFVALHAHVAQQFVESGFAFFALDQEGAGLSPGTRGHLDSLEEPVAVRVEHIRAIRKDYPGVPAFALGESMGGLVALFVALAVQDCDPGLLSGIAVVAPSVGTTMYPFMQRVARVLNWLAPNAPIVKPIHDSGHQHYHDSNVAHFTRHDEPRYFHGSLTPRVGVAFLDAFGAIRQRLGEIALPLLIIHPELDTTTALETSQLLYERARSADKTLVVAKGEHHGILLDFNHRRWIGEMIEWARRRTAEPSPAAAAAAAGGAHARR